MNNLPLLIPLLLVVALFLLSQRTRRKAAVQQLERQRALGPGMEVMTTSGLYGTVAAVLDDEKVTLEVSPGVHVTWARAALRPVTATAETAEPGDPANQAAAPDGAPAHESA